MSKINMLKMNVDTFEKRMTPFISSKSFEKNRMSKKERVITLNNKS